METRTILLLSSAVSITMIGVLVASLMSIQQVTAQPPQVVAGSDRNYVHQISASPLKGTITAGNFTSDLERVKINLATAADIAQKQVPNGLVTRGSLTTADGFLVYAFDVANANGTTTTVLVDPGNGTVLYTVPHGQNMGPGLPFEHRWIGTRAIQDNDYAENTTHGKFNPGF